MNPEDILQLFHEYLIANNAMPTVENDPRITYEGAYSPGKNTIRLHPRTGQETVTHEMTHAVQQALLKQFFNSADPQFKEMWKQQDPKGTVERLAPGTVGKMQDGKDWDKYRVTDEELQAFGTELAVHNYPTAARMPSHVDPTIATELMLLVDTALRSTKNDRYFKHKMGKEYERQNKEQSK
jgi:hypothetical protein